MKKMFLGVILASMTVAISCTEDNPSGGRPKYDPDLASGPIAGSGELLSFTVDIDKTSAEPADGAAPYYPMAEDDFSQQTFATQIAIDMANPVAKSENGVEISVSGGHVTANHGTAEGVCYVVTGTTADGSLTVEGESDCAIHLSGTDIANPASTALDIESTKATYIVLSGSNKLSDGTADKHKGALYSQGKLLFSGTGSLAVEGNYDNGIHTKDYVVFDKGVNLYVHAANHGIKSSNAVINGGIINVETGGKGAKGINCDDNITINGGRTTVVCTGNGEWDGKDQEIKASVCLNCNSVLTIKGGEVNVKATGSGGKGMKADKAGYISGGKIRVITEGGLYHSDGTQENHDYQGDTELLDDAFKTSPKAITIGKAEAHGALIVSGGDIMVRTRGNGGEGMECKGTLDITGGSVTISAHDDAINASDDLTISGGTVVAIGTANDGIDTNGDMHLTGGTVIAMGGPGLESGIDVNEVTRLYLSGTRLFAIGARVDISRETTTQGIVTTSGSVAAHSTVTVSDGASTVASFAMPSYSFSTGAILVSVPGMKNGTSYTLDLGGSTQRVVARDSVDRSICRMPWMDKDRVNNS